MLLVRIHEEKFQICEPKLVRQNDFAECQVQYGEPQVDLVSCMRVQYLGTLCRTKGKKERRDLLMSREDSTFLSSFILVYKEPTIGTASLHLIAP